MLLKILIVCLYDISELHHSTLTEAARGTGKGAAERLTTGGAQPARPTFWGYNPCRMTGVTLHSHVRSKEIEARTCCGPQKHADRGRAGVLYREGSRRRVLRRGRLSPPSSPLPLRCPRYLFIYQSDAQATYSLHNQLSKVPIPLTLRCLRYLSI